MYCFYAVAKVGVVRCESVSLLLSNDINCTSSKEDECEPSTSDSTSTNDINCTSSKEDECEPSTSDSTSTNDINCANKGQEDIEMKIPQFNSASEMPMH